MMFFEGFHQKTREQFKRLPGFGFLANFGRFKVKLVDLGWFLETDSLGWNRCKAKSTFWVISQVEKEAYLRYRASMKIFHKILNFTNFKKFSKDLVVRFQKSNRNILILNHFTSIFSQSFYQLIDKFVKTHVPCNTQIMIFIFPENFQSPTFS